MEGGIFMNKNEQVSYQVLEDFRQGKISRKKTAELLGVSERAVSRRVKRLREEGMAGIKHGNFEKAPANKLPDPVRREAMSLMRQRYYDFNTSHAHELLVKEHGFAMSYVTLLTWCKQEGLARARRRRRSSKARIYRERMANEGMLLQMDGSEHNWNGIDTWHLISVIDDATSNIPAGQFYEGETTWSCMKLLRRVFTARGIPQFLYTDGAGWAGGGGKRQNFSQVVRACEELGIKIIRATSAQAKGRIERSYKTIQDRLVPELRLQGITGMKDANRYLDQVYWPDWNRRFSVEPREPCDRYRKLLPEEDLDQILCLKFDRLVRADHTVSFENRSYKLNPGSLGRLSKKTVTVHQYEDGSLSFYYDRQLVEHKVIVPPKRKWI